MQYASRLYEMDQADGGAQGEVSDDDDGDIESNIQKEIEGIRNPEVKPLFQSTRLDTNCRRQNSRKSTQRERDADACSGVFQNAATN